MCQRRTLRNSRSLQNCGKNWHHSAVEEAMKLRARLYAQPLVHIPGVQESFTARLYSAIIASLLNIKACFQLLTDSFACSVQQYMSVGPQQFLCALAKTTATVSVISLHVPGRPRRTAFREMSYLRLLLKFVDTVQFWSKSEKITHFIRIPTFTDLAVICHNRGRLFSVRYERKSVKKLTVET